MQRMAAAAAAAAAAGGSSKAALQPNQNSMQKLSSRICVRDDPLDGLAGVHIHLLLLITTPELGGRVV
jgi:hypothetical protein